MSFIILIINSKKIIFVFIFFSARLRKILSDTINDLETTRDYQSLKILIDTEIRLEKEEYNLIEENLKSESKYKYLENKFDEDTKKMKARVKNIDDHISEIEGELNVSFYNKLGHFYGILCNFFYSRTLKLKTKLSLN